jgi:hypothetical protein
MEEAKMPGGFEQLFPSLSRWVQGYGYIELGDDDCRTSLIRVLDIGGMLWESESRYPSLDDALQAAEAAVAKILREQAGGSER